MRGIGKFVQQTHMPGKHIMRVAVVAETSHSTQSSN
jgi:hypothetical protein